MNRKKPQKLLLFCLVCSPLLWICLACKNQVASPAQVQETQISWIKKTDAPYKYLDSRFKLHYKSEDEDQKLKIKLRMREDSLLWLSITATAGIEVMRTLITPDSVFIINRLQKEYQKISFDELGKRLNFKIDFNLLQSIVLGTMPFQKYDKAKLKRDGKHLIVKQKVKHLSIDNYLNPQNEQLEQLFLRDSLTQNSVTLIYDKFINYQGYQFANHRKITVNYKEKNQPKKTDITIDHIKIELTNQPLEFPFKVPRRFDEETPAKEKD